MDDVLEDVLGELGVTLEIDTETNTFTIHAPPGVRVIQRCTNDSTEGTSVILEPRRLL